MLMILMQLATDDVTLRSKATNLEVRVDHNQI